MSLKYLSDLIIDLLFPRRCLGCGKYDTWLCAECRKSFLPNRNYLCPVCRNFQSNSVCPRCRPKSFLDGLWILADYDNPITQKLIQLIKYHYVADLAGELDGLIKDYFYSASGWREEFILVPVPLARKRFLSRGFNQAQLVSEAIQRVFGNQIEKEILWRKFYRRPQVGLEAGKRRENIKGNFALRAGDFNHLKNKKLVLVDDVFTTGATMQECARILKENGFLDVWGLVIARG